MTTEWASNPKKDLETSSVETPAKKDERPSAPSSTDTNKPTTFEPKIIDETKEGAGTVLTGVTGYWKNRKK